MNKKIILSVLGIMLMTAPVIAGKRHSQNLYDRSRESGACAKKKYCNHKVKEAVRRRQEKKAPQKEKECSSCERN